MTATPCMIGSVHFRTPTQLAEAAIHTIGLLPRRVGNGARPYEVGIDLAGRVTVDKLGNTPLSEWVMTCTFRSDPDELAEEIRAEAESRKCNKPKRRQVYAGRRVKEAA